MAWNRPTEHIEPLRRNLPPRYLIIVCASIALCVLTYFAVRHVIGENDKLNQKHLSVSKVNQNNSARRKQAHSNMLQRADIESARHLSRDTSQHATGIEKAKPCDTVVVVRHDKELYTCPAEGIIDAVINTQPGEMLLDDDVPEDFEEDFKQSLTNVIVITDDDSEEERINKERVIAVKKELKTRMLLGENVRDILIEEKKELRKLYELKESYEHAIQDLRDEGGTPEDVAACAVAAKEMLSKKSVDLPLNSLEIEEVKFAKEYEAIISDAKNTENKP